MELAQELKFQAEIIKLKKITNQIKELGFDTTKIEIIIKKIEKDLNISLDKISQSYDEMNSIDNLLKSDFLANQYIDALKSIQTLELKLINEYNTYSEINGNLLLIESKLKNITNAELPEIIDLMIITLKKLKSSTINYKDEKHFVESSYKLTYKLIKLELIYFNKSNLLDSVLTNETDTNYTEKYLLEEIDSLDSKKDKYKPIFTRIKQLKSKGLESTYLDFELLNLLKFEGNEKMLSNIKEDLFELSSKKESKQEEINKLVKKDDNLNAKRNGIKKHQNKQLKKLLRYIASLTGWATINLSLILSIGIVNKQFSTSYSSSSYRTEYTEDNSHQQSPLYVVTVSLLGAFLVAGVSGLISSIIENIGEIKKSLSKISKDKKEFKEIQEELLEQERILATLTEEYEILENELEVMFSQLPIYLQEEMIDLLEEEKISKPIIKVKK